MDKLKLICTHNGAFHADEVLACAMLTHHTKQFHGATIQRSRDPKIWEQADIVVDVGGIYDPTKHRYDHHQREFVDTFTPEHAIRLSSAGLIYKHFGREVVQSVIDKLNVTVKLNQAMPPVSEESFEQIYLKLYKNFIQSVDGVDNGVNQYPNTELAKYSVNTSFSSTIGRHNLYWIEAGDEFVQFQQAILVAEHELMEQIKAIYLGWFPGRKFVKEAIQSRLECHPSGQIMVLKQQLGWKSHLYELEQEMEIVGTIKFVLFPDRNEGWRVQAVSEAPESFKNRQSLKEEWCGIKDMPTLVAVSGINDIVFVHANGFIGGAISYESALKMAIESLPI